MPKKGAGASGSIPPPGQKWSGNKNKIFVAQTVERGGGISCNLYKSKDHVVYFLKSSNEVEGSSPFKGPNNFRGHSQ